ncbi:MAG: DNA alkylation repair protein [Methanocorpusculum sp.]|nr:DNA alkylation repair protein [Methanocorpusculum sp.]
MQGSDVNGYIKEELKNLSEPKYREFSSKLLPGTENVLGVRLPHLRNLAKEISKGDWKGYLKNACDDSFEEIMIQGLVIGYAKAEPSEIISALKDFIQKIDNWSVCDSTVMGLKAAAKNQKVFFDFAKKYIENDREFFIRFGAVMLLAHFVNAEYIDRVLLLLDSVKHDGYYAKMAIAWAVSVCYVKFPKETLVFFKKCSLDDWTFNKSIQKIKESFRVSAEDKAMLEKMKR